MRVTQGTGKVLILSQDGHNRSLDGHSRSLDGHNRSLVDPQADSTLDWTGDEMWEEDEEGR